MEIQNYPNYLIYPDGKIWANKTKGRKEGYLKENINKDGYCIVRLTNKEGRKQISVHRLIAIHYISNPNNLEQVDHINRIRHDNRIVNLRWADRITQCNNRNKKNTNKTGYTNIHYCNTHDSWKYKKNSFGIKTQKYFKNKIDAICYKFIIDLKYKTFWNTCRITDTA